MNLATELTKTPSSLAIVAKGAHVSPLGDDSDAPAVVALPDGQPLTIADCQYEMNRAWSEFKDCEGAAIRAGVALGTAAAFAKGLLPHGEFQGWVRKNFPFTEQWARTCMRAAEAYALCLHAPQRMRADIEAANTVEKLAALLRPLQGKEAITRRLTVDKGAKERDDDEVIDVTPKAKPAPVVDDSAITAREAACTKREKLLDAKEKRLQEWEDDLTRRAALLESAKDQSNPIDTLKAAKLVADAKANAKAQRSAGALVSKKAPPSPDAPAPSPAKGRGKGVVAGKGKNAPKISPDTVASIQQAAAVAVAPEPQPIETKEPAAIVPNEPVNLSKEEHADDTPM